MRALNSLRNQSFKDFEIIVIDDNPPEARLEKYPELANLLSKKTLTLLQIKILKTQRVLEIWD
jgi:glycosyltransferase involved in cell wall biosynthesis